MNHKSMDEKIREYLRRKAEDKREQDRNKYSPDYHPIHPDNE